MRIHHLNSTTMCPLGGFVIDGRSETLEAHLVCHCLLIETATDGLVLVDTGFGLEDVRHPSERLSGVFRRLLRPRLDERHTAARQIERLGFRVEDVRHIVLTHLDFDHAGGLDDFPAASVHLLAAEEAVASARRTWLDRMRFRPPQWGSRSRWRTYVPEGDTWFGFDTVRPITGLTEQILLVPLAGHTLGHAGIAVEHEGGWLLHCGDAYFYREEMSPHGHHCSPGLRLYQNLMQQDGLLRLHNQRRLRELVRDHSGEIEVFCAHDVTEFLHFKREELASTGARTDAETERARLPN
jgi:glyoxylase-like metal-dependent hydrolase (beta-lactamase superfamily II)